MANYDANATPNMNFFIPIQPDGLHVCPLVCFCNMDYCTIVHMYMTYIVRNIHKSR